MMKRGLSSPDGGSELVISKDESSLELGENFGGGNVMLNRLLGTGLGTAVSLSESPTLYETNHYFSMYFFLCTSVNSMMAESHGKAVMGYHVHFNSVRSAVLDNIADFIRCVFIVFLISFRLSSTTRGY